MIVTTAGIRDSLAEGYGSRPRVRVVPNGCEVPDQRTFPGLPREQPPRVLYAGQLYPWKGVDVLVEALALTPGARLVILGGLVGESDLARVWKGSAAFVATTAGIRDTFVELHGPHAHVRVVPNGCDVPGDRAFPGLARNSEPRVLYSRTPLGAAAGELRSTGSKSR